MIYRWGASLVGIIAVTIIIISGIQISASGGDSEAINAGKKRILQSIVGIIVLFLSSLILYTVNPTFFTNG
jgi:type IV secretory pathway VirB2 component (pilin)